MKPNLATGAKCTRAGGPAAWRPYAYLPASDSRGWDLIGSAAPSKRCGELPAPLSLVVLTVGSAQAASVDDGDNCRRTAAHTSRAP